MSNSEPRTPYVVSADLSGLFSRWAENSGYNMPSEQFFIDFSVDLRANIAMATGAPVEIIEEKEIKEGLKELIALSPYPVISLDRAYISDNDPNVSGFIDMTRAVNEAHENIGIHARPGFPEIETQIAALRTKEISPITLVDDVIFSGDGIIDLSKMLAAANRPVARIIAGIGIDEGVNRLEADGIEVNCVRRYKEVVDEVCERDFLAGAPMSGRTVICDEGIHWSAPYFEPFGSPERWASIPTEESKRFSRFCLVSSVLIWREIENISGREIAAKAMPRRIKSVDGASSASSSLRRHL